MNTYLFFIFLSSISTYVKGGDKASPYPDGNPDKKGPGISGCRYLGDTHRYCKEDPMSIEKLPFECTSYFYDGLLVSPLGDIIEFGQDYDGKDRLKGLCGSNKNVYVFYFHKTLTEWDESLNAEGQAEKEAETFKNKYFKDYPIKGLVLDHIIQDQTEIPKRLSCNLLKYINAFKKAIPGLQIGLRMNAISVQYHISKNNGWLDFHALGNAVDFYSISFDRFNACSEEFVKTGIIPIDGDRGNTLSVFLPALKKANIPKEKIYFEFLVSPTLPDTAGVYQKLCIDCEEVLTEELPPCFRRYTKLCEGQGETWCADTSCTLRQKGKIAKENGAGFIAFSIDAIDRNVKCDCYNSKYPAFFFLIDGYYDMNKDKVCPKFDRIGV